MASSTRTSSTLHGALRFALLIAVLLVVASLCLLRQARAAVDEVILELGSTLMEYPGTGGEAARQLRLNGARVYFRTQTVEAPHHAVLAHYEGLCDSANSWLGSIATTTVQDARRGYVACLNVGAQPLSLESLVSRFVRFSRTGDLHELGQARYAYAQPIEGSRDSRTFLLTMWTTADFNLHRVLPSEGRDAGGNDPPQVSRPPNSQRVLSSSEVGRSTALAVYLTATSSPSSLERFYREQFAVRGWTVVERHIGERIQVDQTVLVTGRRGGETVTVLAHPGAIDWTVVTILIAGVP